MTALHIHGSRLEVSRPGDRCRESVCREPRELDLPIVLLAPRGVSSDVYSNGNGGDGSPANAAPTRTYPRRCRDSHLDARRGTRTSRNRVATGTSSPTGRGRCSTAAPSALTSRRARSAFLGSRLLGHALRLRGYEWLP